MAEDWAKLGSTREMGEQTAKFFRTELENTWGARHLAVFDEEEAKNWVLGVRIPFGLSPPSRLLHKVAHSDTTSSPPSF